MQKRPVTLDVPAPFLTKIDRIIVLWANIEWKLQQLTYWAAKIGPKQAGGVNLDKAGRPSRPSTIPSFEPKPFA